MWKALYPMPLDLPGSLSTLTPMSFHRGHRGNGEKGTATSAAKAVASLRNRPPVPRILARFPRRSTAYPPPSPVSAWRRGAVVSSNHGLAVSSVR